MNSFKVFVLLCIINIIEGSDDLLLNGAKAGYLWFGTWTPSNDDIHIDDPQLASELSARFEAEYVIKFLVMGKFSWFTRQRSPKANSEISFISSSKVNPDLSFISLIEVYIIITKKNYQGEKTKHFKFYKNNEGLDLDLCEEEIVWCSKLEMQDMEMILKTENPETSETEIKKGVPLDLKIPCEFLGLVLPDNHRKNELLEFDSSEFRNDKGNIKLNLTGMLLKESERDAKFDSPFKIDFYLSEFVLPFFLNGADIKVINQGDITGNGTVKKDFYDFYWEGSNELRQMIKARSYYSKFNKKLNKSTDVSELLENLGVPFRDVNKAYGSLKKKINSTRSSHSNLEVRLPLLEKNTDYFSNNGSEAGVAVNNSSSRSPVPSFDQRSSLDDSKEEDANER